MTGLTVTRIIILWCEQRTTQREQEQRFANDTLRRLWCTCNSFGRVDLVFREKAAEGMKHDLVASDLIPDDTWEQLAILECEGFLIGKK